MNNFAVDGFKLLLPKPDVERVQNFLYNGWTNNNDIRYFVAFAPDGTIPEGVLDTTVSPHDITEADFGGLYTLLTDVYDRNGGKAGMVSAFARVDLDLMIKSGYDVQFDLRGNVTNQNW